MKSLKLFNAVLLKDSNDKPFISENGYIIESSALWSKSLIEEFFSKEKLNGNDLNKTFHKSWSKIKNSSRDELLIDQIEHYISTYGSNFQSEIYIPEEVLNVPDTKLLFKVIKGYSKEEFIEKSFKLINSGIALKKETIDDILTFLVDDLKYEFTGEEKILNKEVTIKIADLYGVIPKDTMEFFRYIIYRTTGESLLIKNRDIVNKISTSSYNPSVHFKKHGLEKLAEIFNRFKPLFLAFKKRCPSTINKISKLSKKYHKPLIENPLNKVTSDRLSSKDNHWLDNATIYALFKALNACYTRKNGQDTFMYRIRNGKSWVKENSTNSVVEDNFEYILNFLKSKYDLSNKKFFLPKGVKFALPTSEKMFVGNIPTGTKITSNKIAVGVYWENDWGANDIDLSGLNIGGKIGWNSNYKQGRGDLMYSGDITNAPNGAVEYLYANNGLNTPTLVQTNVFSGRDNCEYKIIVGEGDKISRDYMMNPNNLVLEEKCHSVQKQTILGIIIPDGDKQSFVLLNVGAGSLRVSSGNKNSDLATKALYQQWDNQYSFKKLIKKLGGEIVENQSESNYNLSLENLEKDSFVKIFS